MLIERHELEPILANVVAAGDRVFTAGAIADDTSLDVAGQTRQALADIDKYLGLCNSNKRQILSAVIWLADKCRGAACDGPPTAISVKAHNSASKQNFLINISDSPS